MLPAAAPSLGLVALLRRWQVVDNVEKPFSGYGSFGAKFFNAAPAHEEQGETAVFYLVMLVHPPHFFGSREHCHPDVAGDDPSRISQQHLALRFQVYISTVAGEQEYPANDLRLSAQRYCEEDNEKKQVFHGQVKMVSAKVRTIWGNVAVKNGIFLSKCVTMADPFCNTDNPNYCLSAEKNLSNKSFQTINLILSIVTIMGLGGLEGLTCERHDLLPLLRAT